MQRSNYSNLVKSQDSDSEFCHTCRLFPGPETQQSTLGQTPAGSLALPLTSKHTPLPLSQFPQLSKIIKQLRGRVVVTVK